MGGVCVGGQHQTGCHGSYEGKWPGWEKQRRDGIEAEGKHGQDGLFFEEGCHTRYSRLKLWL